MKSGITVRAATVSDVAVVLELRLALLEEYGGHPVYGRLRDDAKTRALPMYLAQLTSEMEVIFLAERGADVLGLLRCVEMASSPLLYPDRYGYLSSVYVRPAARRSGVLRALLAAADDWCDERGIDEMRLHNAISSTIAQQTWAALGFEVVEQVRRRVLPVAHGHSVSARGAAHAGRDVAHKTHRASH